ncbi:prepilin-type N-terminal cleavage/methylation domain-containing protein [bacterium]|nr:prepilin-type N-terminal cleavage/methylation domain-containing protein [bacterium]
MTRDRAKPCRRHARRGGFTMTEVAVSMLLLTVGLVAATSTLVAVYQHRDLSKTLMTATNLAEERMEALKSGTYGQAADNEEDFGDIAEYPQFRCVTTVTENETDTLKTVAVDVSSHNGLSVRLETLVAKR